MKKMTKRGYSRKKKRNTAGIRTKLDLPADAFDFDASRSILVSRELWVRAGAPSCFDLISRRLEGAADWDPMVGDAKLVGERTLHPGAVSSLTLSVAGKELDSPAVITRWKKGGSMAWVLAKHPKIKEYWRLEPEPGGTRVHFTLGLEILGNSVLRPIRRLLLRSRMSREANTKLDRLKSAAEAGVA